MSLQNMIETAFEQRADITPATVTAEVKQAVEETLRQLDSGELRVAERLGDALEDWRTLVELADHRMYYAKQHGRDQVCAALPPGHDPLSPH